MIWTGYIWCSTSVTTLTQWLPGKKTLLFPLAMIQTVIFSWYHKFLELHQKKKRNDTLVYYDSQFLSFWESFQTRRISMLHKSLQALTSWCGGRKHDGDFSSFDENLLHIWVSRWNWMIMFSFGTGYLLFESLFKIEDIFVFNCDTDDILKELRISYVLNGWRLLIEASKLNLKAAFIHTCCTFDLNGGGLPQSELTVWDNQL